MTALTQIALEVAIRTSAGRTRPPGELGELLHRVDSWPFVRLELLGRCVTLHSGVRDRPIGVLNLDTLVLTVNVPPDMVSQLPKEHQQPGARKDNVSVRVTDAASRSAAEALIRWRIDLVRFAPQLRDASP
jgi:hypothetical protein